MYIMVTEFGNEQVNEKHYTERLACSKSTKNLIIDDCSKLFLEAHPELRGMTITQNFILRKIAEFYLK